MEFEGLRGVWVAEIDLTWHIYLEKLKLAERGPWQLAISGARRGKKKPKERGEASATG